MLQQGASLSSPMEAVMGEARDGNKEEGYNSNGETGGSRINGEVNGSLEEAMDVCDVPRHDTILLKKVSSDVMSDKSLDGISTNSMSDNVSYSEFDKDNDSDGTGRDKVPISEPVDMSRDLGTEVPGSEEMDVDGDEQDELNIIERKSEHGVGDENEESNDSDGNELGRLNDQDEFKDSDERSRISDSVDNKKDHLLSESIVNRSMDCDLFNKINEEAQEVDPLLDTSIDSQCDQNVTASTKSLGVNEEDSDSARKSKLGNESADSELDRIDHSKRVDTVAEMDCDTPEILDCEDPLGQTDVDKDETNEITDTVNKLCKKTNNSSDISGDLEINDNTSSSEKCERNTDVSTPIDKKKTNDYPSCTSPDDERSNDSLKNKSAENGESVAAKNDEKTDDKDEGDIGNDSKSGESPGKVKKSRKSATLLNLTPRRSSRNLNKQKSYVEKEEDPDIQEITPVDPLADTQSSDPLRDDKENNKARNARKNTIVVNDTKRLVEIAAGSKGIKGGKKEPTLVIIDTNSILSGRGPVPVSLGTPPPGPSSSSGYSVLPVAVPAQGMYPPMRMNNPVPSQSAPVHRSVPPPPPPPQILPTLTDDMYVVEAPSFIVPYVYEKPPNKPLKDFIDQLGKEIQEIKEKEEKEEVARKAAVEKAAAEKAAAEKEASDKEAAEKAISIKSDECADEKVKETDDMEEKGKKSEDNNDTLSDAKVAEKEKESSNEDEKDKASAENSSAKEVKTEGDSQESKESSEAKGISKDEEKSENDVKDVKAGENASSLPTPIDKKPEEERTVHRVPTYFDNPLGKFFTQIGVNLVQEYVQTELLRSQKRKRDREGGKGNATTQFAINSLLKNLEFSKENNEPFHLEQKKCEYCSFKTESSLVMAQHLETPHMRNYVYRCNFCPLEVRNPHDILFHMEAEHNVRGRLERAPAFHQCPNCPFEDNQKGKLTRHLMSCTKKHKPEKNQEPPPDWEPPAKIPRIARSRPTALGLGAAAYQAMAAKQSGQHPLLPKLVPGSSMSAPPGTVGRGRGRPPIHGRYMPPDMKVPQQRPIAPSQIRQSMMYRPGGPTGQPQVLLPATYQIAGNQIYQVVGSQGQVMPMMPGSVPSVPRLTLMPPSTASAGSSVPTPVALVPNIAAGNNSITIQSANNKNPAAKLLQQPSISITPLPRQPTGMAPGNSVHTKHTGHPGHPGHPASKATFVICEICDGYIKDLEQLRNHMQWIHKVKIHPKMIYNRPPLNCQKCQFRFFTDQGLERHLLGSHGLVTSSMQEAANKGKDGGRCPVCGRVYQWKLLNHVARDHNMSLKPAHLSYKCTVCTATFGMYKQFENHVYSAHSVVAKRVMDKKTPQVPRPQSSETLLKPLKINDEITIIPQPARPRPGPASRTGAVPAMMQQSLGKVYYCEKCEGTFDGQTGFSMYLAHVRRRHLRRCSIKLCRLEDCPTCRRLHATQEILDYIEDNKSGVDVIELSDDEVVIAGQGRNEITITKVPCAPGPKRFKQKLQQRHNVQVIELEDSPVKNKNVEGSTSRENGEDSLNAVKERLRRRKSLEISQVDSECSSPHSSDDMPAKKRRRNDDD